ncbi:MAG TPA: prenyltransferase, partial [Ktedonobacteraceae bacterium]
MPSKIVTAAPVQSEDVPTIPLGSLQTINALEPEISVRSVATTRSVKLPAPLVSPPTEYRRGLSEWLQVCWDGIRPAYLPLALMPFLLGSTLAWLQTLSPQAPFGHFRLLQFIAALCAVIALQMGANLVNDYYDFIKGIDTSNPLGPGTLIQQGLMKPIRVLSLGLVMLLLGAVLGTFVAFSGGPYIFLLGIIGLLCAYFYSATSLALSSIALGELVSFCIYGPFITIGAFIAQSGGFASATT